jgi:hypothetical protein
MVGKMKDMTLRHPGPAQPHLRFRRLRPADANLPVLGTALLRHPGVLGHASVFDTLDGIDTMTDDIQALMPDLLKLDAHRADARPDARRFRR